MSEVAFVAYVVIWIVYEYDLVLIFTMWLAYIIQWKRTTLHHAADCGHVQVVETLIKLGADVNAHDCMVS